MFLFQSIIEIYNIVGWFGPGLVPPNKVSLTGRNTLAGQFVRYTCSLAHQHKYAIITWQQMSAFRYVERNVIDEFDCLIIC